MAHAANRAERGAMGETENGAGSAAGLPSETPEQLLRHAGWLRRLTGQFVVDEALADDVAQQTLLLALERPPRDASRPRVWLATAARHVVATFRRGERRRLEREHAVAVGERVASSLDVVAQAALHHAGVVREGAGRRDHEGGSGDARASGGHDPEADLRGAPRDRRGIARARTDRDVGWRCVPRHREAPHRGSGRAE
ncbi:MAG: hypothetical protein EXS13_06070 [Planctomycetes bacterium]|nr:hypothetical protein [Planctomycetota bacterium]